MKEGLGVAFQTQPQFSANPSLKNEVYAQVRHLHFIVYNRILENIDVDCMLGQRPTLAHEDLVSFFVRFYSEFYLVISVYQFVGDSVFENFVCLNSISLRF